MTADDRITRRQAIRQGGLWAAGAVLGACSSGSPATEPAGPTDRKAAKMTHQPMPTVFLPHGGGPWPFTNEPLGPPGTWDRMSVYMKALGQLPPTKPRAILVVSAHWEEAQPTLLSAPKPPMLYDYYNFPPEAYEVQWPAPGAPDVAGEIAAHLQRAGFQTASDPERGFDHGTFVPLKLAYPRADVPTLQLSLKKGLDPAEHLKMGRALQPLRAQGVFIVGSGMSYHNMKGMMTAFAGGPSPTDDSKAFDDWLEASASLPADARETKLVEWEQAPAARACHPREEHLLPLHVVAGAAGNDAGSLPYRDVVTGIHFSAVHFG